MTEWHAAYFAALRLEGDDREEYLASLDSEHRALVEAKLAADRDSDTESRFLEMTAPVGNTQAAGSLPASRLPGGSVFGRYRIDELLGEGGMGLVYSAKDEVLGRRVAIKIPKTSFEDEARNREVRKRFEREARAAATLSHPNICPVYDFGEVDGHYYLAMEFIEGTPLSDRVPGNPLGSSAAGWLVLTLAEALQEAHSRGVLHRDLKPSNVLINHRGQPVVMDFGLATVEGDTGSQLTRTGDFLGTPAYSSPEQLRGELSSLTPASDVYSLGVMLYAMLTGRLPFAGESAIGVVTRTITEPAPRVEDACETADSALADICNRMRDRDPQHRIASMSDVISNLRECASFNVPMPGGSQPDIFSEKLGTAQQSDTNTTSTPVEDQREESGIPSTPQARRLTYDLMLRLKSRTVFFVWLFRKYWKAVAIVSVLSVLSLDTYSMLRGDRGRLIIVPDEQYPGLYIGVDGAPVEASTESEFRSGPVEIYTSATGYRPKLFSVKIGKDSRLTIPLRLEAVNSGRGIEEAAETISLDSGSSGAEPLVAADESEAESPSTPVEQTVGSESTDSPDRFITSDPVLQAALGYPGFRWWTPKVPGGLDSSPFPDATPSVTQDSTALFLSRDLPGSDRLVLMSERASSREAWGTPRHPIVGDSLTRGKCPWISGDGSDLFFVREFENRESLAHAEMTAHWDHGVRRRYRLPITQITDLGREVTRLSLSPDLLEVFWVNREGAFSSRRSAKTAPWSEPRKFGTRSIPIYFAQDGNSALLVPAMVVAKRVGPGRPWSIVGNASNLPAMESGTYAPATQEFIYQEPPNSEGKSRLLKIELLIESLAPGQ